MIVLHGSWLPASGDAAPAFAVWAESSESEPARRRGRAGKAARPHPYAASFAALRAALAAPSAEPDELTLLARLPTAGGAPQPSRPFLRDDAGDGPLTLEPWLVPALAFDGQDAPALLSRLPPPDDPTPGLEIGPDLHFWTLAARFALELLAGQRFVPDLIEEENQLVAVWTPVLDAPPDQERLALLAGAMPPACRALARAQPEPPMAPGALLRDFLETVVDARASAAAALPPPPKARATPAQQWLAALGGENPVVALPPGFVAQFRAWRDAGRAADQGNVRICFRLDPPQAAGDWVLRYFLQASDDPSLLVPAEQVWRERGRTLKWLNRVLDQPQERLLAGLGLAARVFPPIERSLRSARPTDATLDLSEAYSFIREAALLLRGSGFGVLLPNLSAALSARAKVSPSQRKAQKGGVAGLSVDTILRFDWELALGDQPLTQQELERLAALKVPLVQVRGQWVELRPEQLERALALLAQPAERELTLAEALRVTLAPASVAGLPVEQVEAEGWFSAMLDELNQPSQLQPLPPPAGLRGTLRHYQQAGVSWLAFLRRFGLGACLADDMGLGKTLQTIAFLLHLRETGDGRPETRDGRQETGDERRETGDGRRGTEDGGREMGDGKDVEASRLASEPSTSTGPALIICPTSVVGNWRRELERFAPGLRVMVHHGAERERAGFAARAAQHDIVISAYPLLYRDEQLLREVAWGELILDEAQNIKNPDTRQSRAARALPADHRIALTGTPIENRLAELWSIFQFLNPGYLGSQSSFQAQFARPIERVSDPDAAKELKALVGPFILRRLKTDPAVISDLPAKNEIKTFCTLTKEQATLYQAVVRDSIEQIEEAEGIGRRGLVLSTLLRLKQVCNHPAQFLDDGSVLPERSGKLERLAEMLEELRAARERALIFTQFAEMGQLITRYLRSSLGEEALFLHGGTPAKQREPMVRRFQEDPHGPAFFVLSIKAGGVGLNLTRANNVFHFDRWWNPAVENQATDRAFRIGQTRVVQVYKYICAGTVEERIDEMIERKQALAERIVGTSENWITELSTEQLRELFALREDALG